jgi:8-oxo-dGTP diphosphatase
VSEGKYVYAHPRPAVTVDIALFRHAGSAWEILFIQRARDPFKGKWALPGGFVDEMEPLEAAAARELKEECGIQGVELWQFRAFGDPHRDPRGHTISIGFLGVARGDLGEKAADDASSVRWFPITALPDLAFDHPEIVAAAIERLHRIEV